MMTYSAPQLLDKVNAYLKNMPYSRPPKGLYEPIAYELSLGGKRIRPVLMLMSYNLYKEDVDSILSQAAGLETYHNHTLLHDDVMDKADMRRNKPTVHNVWNENTAILSGDAMLILAYRLMSDCPKDKLAEVLHTFTETTMEICEGQQWDMEFETRMDVKVDEYIEMIRLKTSVLLAAALKIGAYLADAPAEDAEKLYEFGVKMGLAFQLQDDLLDSYGTEEELGKKIGGDILEGKKTFLMVQALSRASEQEREVLCTTHMRADISDAEKIATIKALYDKLDVRRIAEQQIELGFERALNILDTLSIDSERVTPLVEFARNLMGRKK